jgi:hypothetical protein
MRLKKRFIALAALIGAVAAISTVALATQSTTINPANAPTGTHFKSGAATCTVGSTSVTCSGYTLAGVGNINATATLSVVYSATVVCVNNGNNTSDGQHQGTFSSTTGPVSLQSKNGNLTVPQLTNSAPTAAQFLAQQTCPNPNWTPTIPGGITLQSFSYTLQFAGFGGNYITISGNDP